VSETEHDASGTAPLPALLRADPSAEQAAVAAHRAARRDRHAGPSELVGDRPRVPGHRACQHAGSPANPRKGRAHTALRETVSAAMRSAASACASRASAAWASPTAAEPPAYGRFPGLGLAASDYLP
jgi:hypothetical protein